jgi:hypothetical protein
LVKVLLPTGCCDPHPEGGTYVWLPPPAAAATAIERLGQSIHKIPGSVHIAIVSRLMTACWRKRLSKISDLLFTIPVGTKVWPDGEHEPLICAVCLPLSQHSPWSHRGTSRSRGVHLRLSKVWENDEDASRSVLRQLLGQTRALAKV